MERVKILGAIGQMFRRGQHLRVDNMARLERIVAGLPEATRS